MVHVQDHELRKVGVYAAHAKKDCPIKKLLEEFFRFSFGLQRCSELKSTCNGFFRSRRTKGKPRSG